jgi:subtilisin family serine protease
MSVGRKWLITLTGFAAAMVVASPEAMASDATPTPAPLHSASAKTTIAGKYIVVLKSDSAVKGDLHAASASATAASRARSYGAKVDKQFSHAIKGYSATLTEAQLAKVRQDPDVAYVEPDTVIKLAPDNAKRADAGPITAKGSEPVGPNDADAWNLDRIDQRSRPLDNWYNYTADGSFVTAYIIDSGIYAPHPEFQGRVKAGHDSVGDGWGTDDCEGHGTHVAGTVGSATFGVAKNVNLVPVRVLGCDGSGTTSGVIDGVDWVTANHAAWPVANMSLGGQPDDALDAAINRSIDSGITYVVAAGNEDADACVSSPSRVPNALTVAASDVNDARSIWYDQAGNKAGASNYGSCVDLFAPGTEITSTFNPELTWPDGGHYGYAIADGTSMAAPHVTGAAALYLQKNLGATPAEIRAAIVGAATPNVITDVQGSPSLLLYTPGVSNTVTPKAPSSPDRVKSGEALLRNGSAGQNHITSPDGRFTLILQPQDGNLVLYEYGKRALWATGQKSAAAWMLNQPDGNLVDNNANGAYAGWASKTSAGRSTLVLQNDGNAVLYRDSDHKVIWSTGTCCHGAPPPQPAFPADRLAPGQAIVRGQQLTSPNGTYTLVLQNLDGNLVLYKNGTKALWAFGPRADSWFTAQTDGNLVAYKSEGGVAWSAKTNGKGAGNLVLQDDGNLVLYRVSDHTVIWSTKTNGK